MPAGPAPAPRPRGRRRALAIGIVLLAVAAAAWYFVSRLGVESTDDAFLDADVYQLSFKVPGRVAEVHVVDNEVVEEGRLVAELDPAGYAARVEGARAALELARAREREARVQVDLTEAATTAALARARAGLTAAQARLEQHNADLASARAESERAQADLARYQELSDRAVSKARLDEIRQDALTTGAALLAVQKRIASAQADIEAAQADVVSAEADRARVDAARAAAESAAAATRSAEAGLREAELELADTRLLAPAAGRVTRKAVLAGSFVQPGQIVTSLVAPQMWVTANFKETQLEDMRPGQEARIHVDAYDIELSGHVESIQAGSGARFSLLPPENATGNYVKVVQRVPVKIVLDAPLETGGYLLGPGMSVVPVVRTR